MRVYSTTEIKPLINLLVYAEPGMGKTTLAASAAKHPDMSPVLIVNIEGGLLSVAGVPNVDAVDISSVAQLEELFWKLVNKEEDFGKYKTVVIDSGTELQTLDLESIAAHAWKEEQKKPAAQRSRTNIDDLWQKDYGENTAKLKRVFRWFKDAPFHTIITALVRETYGKKRSKDSEPKLESVAPAFTNKLSQSVMGYCDFVWYLYTVQGEDTEKIRCLLTQMHGVFRAKTRGHNFAERLGLRVDNPDLSRIYNLLLESEGLTNNHGE